MGLKMRAEQKLLSECDRKIIALIADGYTYSSISQQLGIKEFKVKIHIQIMLQEHGFATPFQLITWAYHDAIII